MTAALLGTVATLCTTLVVSALGYVERVTPWED